MLNYLLGNFLWITLLIHVCNHDKISLYRADKNLSTANITLE